MLLKSYKIITLLLFVNHLMVSAQVFYSEDFSGGNIPAGWTSIDATSVIGEHCLFQFTTDPSPTVYAPGDFLATTVGNGYLVANSDEGISSPGREIDHTTQLTTAAIDCSGQEEVWLFFETLLGVFQAIPAEENAIVRVSTDGVNWTDFVVFPGFVTNDSWTDNPKIVSIDISIVAANEATVYIQWQWIGNWEYIWSIDDIKLSTEDLRLVNDMRINSFAAFAPNTMTPVSQIEPLGFLADIENVGSEEQFDINLIMSIINGNGMEVFSDTLNYDMIASDSLAQNVFFLNTFTPDAEVQSYAATYYLDYNSTEEDGFPDNNELIASFAITEKTFAKELGPSEDLTIFPEETLDFSYGNVFYINNAVDADNEQLYADQITFAVAATTTVELEGQTVEILLYAWNGQTVGNNEQYISLDMYALVGSNDYTFTGMEGTDLISVDVTADAPVALQANTYYMPVIRYANSDGVTKFRLLGSNVIDYNAMIFYSNTVGASRYAAVLDLHNDGTLDLIGFGQHIVPVVRFSIKTIPDAIEEAQLAVGAVSIFPNPAATYTTVYFDLKEASSGQAQLVDIQGKVAQTHVLNNVQLDQLRLNTTHLASGQYTLRIQTELGVSTQKLIIQH